MMHCMSEPQALRSLSQAFCSALIVLASSGCADLTKGEYWRASSSSSDDKVGSLQIAISAGSFAFLQSKEAAAAGLAAMAAVKAIRIMRNMMLSPVEPQSIAFCPARLDA